MILSYREVLTTRRRAGCVAYAGTSPLAFDAKQGMAALPLHASCCRWFVHYVITLDLESGSNCVFVHGLHGLVTHLANWADVALILVQCDRDHSVTSRRDRPLIGEGGRQ